MKLEKEWYINGYEQYKNPFGDSAIQIKLSIVKPTDDVIKYFKNYNHHNVKMTLEVEEPILDEVEKRYLIGVIRPFRDRIEFIKKSRIYGQEYINIVYNSEFKDDTNFCLPLFEPSTMYKGMKLGKEYTLEELGL